MGKLAGKTALIIDDNSSAIRVLEQLLIRESMTSLGIQDTHNIRKHLANASVPDVIFLDLEMPFTNGYAVLETIKGDARFKNVPVIAYTTHISHLNDAKRAGFDGFLGKPVDGRVFGSLVERILNGEKVWEVPN
jgi:two-component system, cell cycle response regulator DivK